MLFLYYGSHNNYAHNVNNSLLSLLNIGITFGFDRREYRTSESTGFVTYSVTVISGQLGRPIQLQVTDNPGSATG